MQNISTAIMIRSKEELEEDFLVATMNNIKKVTQEVVASNKSTDKVASIVTSMFDDNTSSEIPSI